MGGIQRGEIWWLIFPRRVAPKQDKRHVIYETSHWVPRNPLIQETLAWFDRYLGRVKTAP
jgi:hypothetical protein